MNNYKVSVQETTNRVSVTDNGIKIVVKDPQVKVLTIGTQGPAGSSSLGGKSVEPAPTLNGGEFLVYDATDDRFEFVSELDGGLI